MILAAGVGERMRPLTDITPKPLLEVAGKPLIHYHLDRLAAAGVEDIVINTCYLAEQIEENLGGGEQWGLNIEYSRETEALETAGGIIRALPLLGTEPFMIVNADIWTDYAFEQLLNKSLADNCTGHCVMVDNPPQHIHGDFFLSDQGFLSDQQRDAVQAVTYAGIAIYTADFFAGVSAGKSPLRPLMVTAMAGERLSGEHYKGKWLDVGTPERLEQLERQINAGVR